jgi:hypothetical protein
MKKKNEKIPWKVFASFFDVCPLRFSTETTQIMFFRVKWLLELL